MIGDGPLYKKSLWRLVAKFERDLSGWPWPPDRATGAHSWEHYWGLRFETTLFSFGLGLRKLIEAGKLSIEFQADPVLIEIAPLKGDCAPDMLNYDQVSRFYDLDNLRTTEVPVIDLTHQIVHSYVLVPHFLMRGDFGLRLDGFFLASDTTRKSRVYWISWSVLRTLAVKMVSDDVEVVRSFRTGEGDYIKLPSRGGDSSGDAAELIILYRSLSKTNNQEMKKFMKKWKEKFGRDLLP
jgi:hypothetical protein